MPRVTVSCFLLALLGCVSAQFEPQELWDLARKGRSKRLSCTSDSPDSVVHWYRAEPGQALKRILYFAQGAASATVDSGFGSRFSGGKKGKIFSLTITGVTEGDAATYYCARWSGDTVTQGPLPPRKNPQPPSFTQRSHNPHQKS